MFSRNPAPHNPIAMLKCRKSVRAVLPRTAGTRPFGLLYKPCNDGCFGLSCFRSQKVQLQGLRSCKDYLNPFGPFSLELVALFLFLLCARHANLTFPSSPS